MGFGALMEDEVVFDAKLLEEPEDALGLRVLPVLVGMEIKTGETTHVEVVKRRHRRFVRALSRHFEETGLCSGE